MRGQWGVSKEFLGDQQFGPTGAPDYPFAEQEIAQNTSLDISTPLVHPRPQWPRMGEGGLCGGSHGWVGISVGLGLSFLGGSRSRWVLIPVCAAVCVSRSGPGAVGLEVARSHCNARTALPCVRPNTRGVEASGVVCCFGCLFALSVCHLLVIPQGAVLGIENLT